MPCIPKTLVRKLKQFILCVVLEQHYTVVVVKEDASGSFIEKGFLKCHVEEHVQHFRRRTFIFCLHCFKLRSPSWWYSHRGQTTMTITGERRDFTVSNFNNIERRIVREIDIVDAVGDLFKEPRSYGLSAETDRSGPPQSDGMVESPRAGSFPGSSAFEGMREWTSRIKTGQGVPF